MILLTAAESRELDRISQEKFGVDSYALMTRAGEACAEALVALHPRCAETGVLVVAGKGNNGGDGFVAGRRLFEACIRAYLGGRSGRPESAGRGGVAHSVWQRCKAGRACAKPTRRDVTLPGKLARPRLRRAVAGGQFDHQMAAMLAPVFIGHAHRDAMGAGFEVAR